MNRTQRIRIFFLCTLALLLLSVPCALADGAIWDGPAQYDVSSLNAPPRFGDYYVSGDSMGGLQPGDAYVLRVISKSATLWSQPRTNSPKLATVQHGEALRGIPADGTSVPTDAYGFYPAEYKGKRGYINADYVVLAPLEIVLMESNVPAYCAPDTSAKKVGSLSKLTRYPVLGFWGDYYIISLRQAAAFVPMDVAHYDSTFEALLADSPWRSGVTNQATTLRAGPGSGYASVKDVNVGYELDAGAYIDGWYAITYRTGEGSALVYVSAADVTLSDKANASN
jgi:hypothetical protein